MSQVLDLTPAACARCTLATAVALAVFAAPSAAQFGTNIIVNGDAESGSTAGFTVVSPGLEAVSYAAGNGFPDAGSPGPANRGQYFFGGGNSSITTATQFYNFAGVTGLPMLINAGDVRYTLSAYLGGYANQDDNATLTADFLNASSATIGSAVIGPVLSADRSGVTGLLFRSADGFIPVGAQSVRFTLQMTRTFGGNDGYADNLSFVLANGTPGTTAPEPTTWALMAGGLGGLGLFVRRRGRA